jgi:phage terminase small subunit
MDKSLNLTAVGLPIHTNKVVAAKREKRDEAAKRNSTSQKSLKAIASGDVQAVIDSLNDRQRIFCEEYLTDLNATAAATRAGYEAKNARQLGSQLMDNQAVRITIDALRAERSKRSDITKDFVLQGIKKATRLAEEAGNLNALLRGYELLAKHLGMFVERTEISGPDGEAIKMEQKIKEDVADFTSSIARLARRSNPSS